jgi:hypothetical protein
VLTILVGLFRVVAGAIGGVAGAGGGGGANEELVMVLLVGYGVYSILMGGFLVYAGIQMREAKQYALSMIACVVALIPGVSPCCLLGLIFGIMGISKLNEARVKRGFEANRTGYDPDGYN